MRILLVASYTINMMPYVRTYTDILNKLGIDYDVIQWDRFKNHELVQDENIYTFGEKCSLGGDRIKKIVPYIHFRKSVVYLIKKNNYSNVIVFNTLPAIFIIDYLVRGFYKKFIFDYRDYSYEKYSFYKMLVNYIVDKSYATVISSKGFLKFIDYKKNVYVSHNISNCGESYNTAVDLAKANITIGFVGLVRYDNEDKNLIDQLKNHHTYKLLYVGKKYIESTIEEYCKNEGITNVKFSGEFKNEDKPKIYEEIDIINAIYGNETYEVTTALPNKLYDCLIFKRPMIVSSGTYLAEIVKKYNLGIAVDKDDDILNKLEYYIQTFDKDIFISGIEELFSQINKDIDNNRDMIERFLLNGKVSKR